MKERALKVIEDGRITLVPEQKAWIVTGSSGNKYTVQLFRNGEKRPKCSCPASISCCHILAAMMSVDCVTSFTKKTTILRMERNSRKAADRRKGGRKQPKAKDTEKKARSLLFIIYLSNFPFF